MDKFLNEELFEVVLEKAFIEHEKELLKSYPDDVELDRKYPISKKEIRRFKNIVKEKEYGKKLVRVYLERAAVIVLCMISLFFALIMTSPEVRAAVENVILKWYDKYTEFIFTDVSIGFDAEKVEDVEIGYVPEDFILDFEEEEKQRFLYYKNSNDEEKYLTIEIFYSENTNISMDNERYIYEKLTVNSCEAWLSYSDSDDFKSIILVGPNVTVCIAGMLSVDEIIKIAENVK